jgi:hypothetical protein
MAAIERRWGARDRAISLQRKALEIVEARGSGNRKIQLYSNLAVALLDGATPRDLEEFDALTRKGIEIADRIGQPAEKLLPYLLRADAARERGDLGQARTELVAALASAKQPGASLLAELQVYRQMLRVARDGHDVEEIRRVIDAAEDALSRAPESAETPAMLSLIARTRWEFDYDRKRAIAAAERALAIYGRLTGADSERSKLEAWLAAHR